MPPPRSSRRTLAWLTLIGLAIAAAITLLIAALLLPVLTPSWWNPPRVPSAQGESVEHDVLRELTRVRPTTTEPWTLTIREDDLNAWLATRLRPWLASRNIVTTWPDNVGLVQADISPKGLRVGAQFVHNPTYSDVPVYGVVEDSPPPFASSEDARIIWLHLAPEVHPDGQLFLTLHSGGVGRLPLSASHLSDRVAVLTMEFAPADQPPPEGSPGFAPIARSFVDVLMGRAPLLSETGLPIDAARRVVVQAITLREGELDLTLRTRAAE